MSKKKPKYKVGDKIRLKGKIRCGQDFSFGHITFLKEKEFTIRVVFDHEAPNYRYGLEADGYGDLKRDYGNGSISVYEKDLGGEEVSKKFHEEYALTQRELLENLDRNYVHRLGIQTISDSVAYNQIKDMIEKKFT